MIDIDNGLSKKKADSLYVNIPGDTMTGDLSITSTGTSYFYGDLQVDGQFMGIRQLTADPTSPSTDSAWVLRTGSGSGSIQVSTLGVPMGLLLSLTYAQTLTTTGIAYTYQFSYRTKEGTTVRATIS